MVYDIVVFGATGFTGVYVVQYLKKLGVASVAIAGRTQAKLDAVNVRCGSNYDTIIANAGDPASLAEMAKQAKVLLNCVGPYRLYGEAVVKACVESGTNYLDISGEPEFIERVEHVYGQSAKDSNCTIVSACGFDSIPADMGTAFAVEQFVNRNAVPSLVDSYLSLSSGSEGICVHYTTYECAVLGFGSVADLRNLRRQVARVDIPTVGPKPKKAGTFPTWDKTQSSYRLPFPGSDASIVRRSQKYLVTTGSDTPTTQYSAWFTIKSGFWTSVFMTFATVFGILANFSFGRSLLLRYPRLFTMGLFSHEGPTEQQLANTAFAMDFRTSGYSSKEVATQGGAPDVKIHTRVSGPEPGYVATPICIVQCALELLAKESSMPRGVLTPASAFRNTDLIARLTGEGIRFEVLSE
eukprot:m.19298 g.19298  ORF g.19298 m.19298 type:complete len:410 (+) comp8012_c0_seq1:271-1500(+)